MTQIVEKYANQKVLERDKETAKSRLQNGVSADVVIKSITTVSMEFIGEIHRQLVYASSFFVIFHPPLSSASPLILLPRISCDNTPWYDIPECPSYAS